MSDENAVPEVPAEAPATAVEQPAAPLESEATAGAWVSGQPETFTPAAQQTEGAQTEAESVQSVESAVASPADDLASRIAALEPATQVVLKDVLGYISDGFNNYSLMVGVLRLAELLK